MQQLILMVFFAQLGLNLGPEVWTGVDDRGLQQLAGLIGDVLQVADERGAVGTCGQMGVELRAFNGRAFSEEIGQLLLELGAGERERGWFVHAAPSVVS